MQVKSPRDAGGEFLLVPPTEGVRDQTGQATTEYAVLLALVAAALVGAGALVGLDTVGKAVASGVRTGICIAGGDICRASDAAAAGLSPCTVSDSRKGSGTVVSVGWLRLGEAKGLTVATRSDGSVLITRTHERRGGGGAGIGVDVSPLGINLGADVSADFALTSGEAWEFPDAASAARFLAGRSDPPPVWRFGEAAEILGAQTGARLGIVTLAGAEASAQGGAGARVGRGRTTLYIRARLDAGVKTWTPGGTRTSGPTTGDVIVELALESGEPREIAFRRLGADAAAGRVVDTVARLDLRDPANRAAASRLLAHAPPWRTAARELHAVLALAVQRGTVEQAVYDVRDDSGSVEVAARLGAELGIDVSKVRVERRLVGASAWVGGSRERVREDCLM
jgi:Flp pilus assembly pilin Flp